jgi:hypothetical protein
MDNEGSPEDLLESWLSDRPEKVREVARKYPPWNVYVNKPTGQKCMIVAYAEDGTVRANCWRDELGEAFAELTAVQVFGMDPNDFELLPTGDKVE